jgi:hypothetical protein
MKLIINLFDWFVFTKKTKKLKFNNSFQIKLRSLDKFDIHV